MTQGFALRVTGGTFGVAAGASALAVGLALQATGYPLFGIAGAAYAGVGAITWLAGIALLIVAARAHRSRPRAAVSSRAAVEANKEQIGRRIRAALFFAAALVFVALFTLTGQTTLLAIGVMNLGLGVLCLVRRT